MYRWWVSPLVVVLALLGAGCGAGSDDAAEDSGAETEPTASEFTAPATTAPVPTPTSTPEPSLGSLLPSFDSLGTAPVTEVDPVSIDAMCPGWDQFEGLTVTQVATRTFRNDPVLGPFMTVGLLDLGEAEADALLDAYVAGTTGPCAAYQTTGATGNTLSLGWSEISGPERGDRTVTLGVRGDSDGFPVNSDVVLVRVGDRVGYVGYLVVGGLPSPSIRDAAVDAMVKSLAGENAGTVDTTGSVDPIVAALPGLDELAEPGLLDEANDAVLPNAQCPDNPTTLDGLSLVQAGARRFLGDPDFGPHVTVAILEFGAGDADTFIDRWVDGANGPCADYTSGALEFGWTVGSGPEYLDRTITLFGRGSVRNTADPASSDYVLVRSGNFVGYMHYFLTNTPAPDPELRDAMVQSVVEALEDVSNGTSDG